MGVNIEGKTKRDALLIHKKLVEGKSLEKCAEELDIHKSTAGRDWRKLKQDATLTDWLEELKLKALSNAMDAQDVENNYINQLLDKEKEKEDLSPQEINTLNTVKVSSQKMYSFLAGENAKANGGEKFEVIKYE